MIRSFLDLTELGKSRADLRRLEKQLKSSPEYCGKEGRVFFFIFDTPIRFQNFIASMLHGVKKIGDRAILCEKDNPWYKDNNLPLPKL